MTKGIEIIHTASAADYVQAGLSVIPIKADGSKAPPRGFTWKKYQSTIASPAQCEQWQRSGFGNGIVGGKASGGLEVIDIDQEALFEPFSQECERLAPGLLARLPLVKTPEGRHIYLWSESCEGSRKLAQSADRETLIEIKGEGGYVLAPGSPPACHPSNKPYEHIGGPPTTEKPQVTAEERGVLLKVARSFNELVDQPDGAHSHASNGRSYGGASPGDVFNERAVWEEILEPHEWVKDHSSRGKAFWRRPGKDRGWSATTGCVSRHGTELFCCFSSNASPLQGPSGSSPCRSYSKFSLYAALNHAGDYSAAAKALAKKGFGSMTTHHATVKSGLQSNGGELQSDPWPDPLDEAAFHGIAGEIVRTIEPHTEADPVAVLVQFLTAFGNLIGRNAFFRAEADKHRTNLFTCLVGATSKGRKGTSWGQSRRLLETVDADWCGKAVGGLSSGEGLVWAVRDPIYKKQPVYEGRGKDKRIVRYDDVLADAGVEDKRVLILESEFSSVLKVAAREKNTLSAIIRQAWDSGRLAILNKNSPARATDAHISIIGHITRDELRRQITETDMANGLANRFLWLCVRRSKLLPDGGEFHKVDVGPLVERLHEAVEFALVAGEVKRNDAAREVWHEVYPTLSAGKLGLLGAATSRAEAQVMRLAMIYSLLDRRHDIGAEHLLAGLALWEYAEQSARYIFGSALGDPAADEILAQLRQRSPEGMTRTEIRDLFGRNKQADEINRAISVLLDAGFVRQGQRETGGRPAEVLFAAA